MDGSVVYKKGYDMKDEIMKRIMAVLNALNNVSVSGKSNIGNLGGSIAMMEEIAGILENADITPIEHEQQDKSGGR